MMSTWRIGTSVLLLICLYMIEGGYGQGDAKYLIGAGIADITGPAADVPLVSTSVSCSVVDMVVSD